MSDVTLCSSETEHCNVKHYDPINDRINYDPINDRIKMAEKAPPIVHLHHDQAQLSIMTVHP